MINESTNQDREQKDGQVGKELKCINRVVWVWVIQIPNRQLGQKCVHHTTRVDFFIL